MRFALLAVCLMWMGFNSQASADTTWTEKVSLYGDFRFRNQFTQVEDKPDRFRQRLRARLGTNVTLDEKFKLNFRLASGEASNTITSANQSFNSNGDKKPIWIDLAYVDFTPAEKIEVIAGKMNNPYWAAGKSEVVFDADWTPEGMAFKGGWDLDAVTVSVNAGAHWLKERAGSGTDSKTDVMVYGAQAGVGYKQEKWGTTLAIATYEFTKLKGESNIGSCSSTTLTNTCGNSATVPGVYDNEYKLMNLGVEFDLMMAPMPIKIYGENTKNSDPKDDNTAMYAGVRYGQTKEEGDWMIDLSTREVKKDAVFGLLTESDSWGGGTDGKTMQVKAAYQISKPTGVAFTYSDSKTGISGTEKSYKNAMLDLMWSF